MELKELLHTTPGIIKKLHKLGVTSYKQMLFVFPRAYEDLSTFTTLAKATANGVNVIKGTMKKIESTRARSGMPLLKGVFEDEEGNVCNVIWFNQVHMKNTLKTGARVVLIGKIKMEFGKLTMVAPTLEYWTSDSALVHSGKIVPVYAETEGLGTEWWRSKMVYLKPYISQIEETLPEEIRKEYQLPTLQEAIRELHFPTSTQKVENARRRMAFEELFFLQLAVLYKKKRHTTHYTHGREPVLLDAELIQDFIKKLPFELTEHQKISIFQILKDMEKETPMVRLLQGDVGAGKTVVALTTAFHAIKKGGGQVAVMAPTELLARQHFEKMAPFFLEHGISMRLLIGSLSQKEKAEVHLGLASGTIDLVVGTHALVQDGVTFPRLHYAIVDEQHRFGVEQRKKLSSHGMPHVLHMTATPIPRTLTLTLYGDQEVSIIRQMPKGRKPIITKIVPPHQKQQIYRFIEDQVQKGRQAFIICPLIEESEQMEDVRAATREYNILREQVFPDLRIALLHGKMKAEEKDATMLKFKEKEYDILVSTSVIEVGIDIPNATVMVIEGAERFGLSQLHQFRGRVGRGDVQSYCFLSSEKGSARSNPRLRSMEKHHDGFLLAEIDLELRGPGEVYGIRQSGLPDLKMANLLDLDLVLETREAATKILEQDPDLTHYPLWKSHVEERSEDGLVA